MAELNTLGSVISSLITPASIGAAARVDIPRYFDSWQTATSSPSEGSSTIIIKASLTLEPQAVRADHFCTFVRDDDLTKETSAVTTSDDYHYSPADQITPLHYGAMGVKSRAAYNLVGWLLSDLFGTLEDAQEVFPAAVALTDTVDSAAITKMARYVKTSRYFGTGIQNPPRQSMADVSFWFPRGAYVINRACDFTSINLDHAYWSLKGDRAIIFIQGSGNTGFDILDSRKMVPDGITFVGEWVPGVGVPRSAIQIGRAGGAADSRPADSHAWGTVNIDGRFSLAGVHNFASEDNRLGSLSIKNKLDHRNHYFAFEDGTSGTLTLNEKVTWSGGGRGVIELAVDDVSTGSAIVKVYEGTLADGTVITGTNGKSITVDGALVTEPMGEGPDGRSYCLVQDGDNYWGIESDFVDAPPPDVAASFLRNCGFIDCRHTGRGDAVWLTRAVTHDYTNSYVVSTDPQGGAGWVLFFNTSTEGFTGLKLDCHVESDEADEDVETGISYEVKFDAAVFKAEVTLQMFEHRRNRCQVGLSQFQPTENIGAVVMSGPTIKVHQRGRDTGQVMFGSPEKFTLRGAYIYNREEAVDFLNISALATISGHVHCFNAFAPEVQHNTGRYLLTDETGRRRHMNGVSMLAASGGGAPLEAATRAGVVLSRIDMGDNAFTFSYGSGADFKTLLTATAFYNISGVTKHLGLSGNRWGQIWAASLDITGVATIGSNAIIKGNARIYAAPASAAIIDFVEDNAGVLTNKGRLSYTTTNGNLNIACNGTVVTYVGTADAFYPQVTGTQLLGLNNRQWEAVHSLEYRVNNTKVVGAQQAAIDDIAVSATTGTLPTAAGTLVIADAAAPTVVELLAYARELEAKLESALAAMRTHGLIATT